MLAGKPGDSPGGIVVLQLKPPGTDILRQGAELIQRTPVAVNPAVSGADVHDDEFALSPGRDARSPSD